MCVREALSDPHKLPFPTRPHVLPFRSLPLPLPLLAGVVCALLVAAFLSELALLAQPAFAPIPFALLSGLGLAAGVLVTFCFTGSRESSAWAVRQASTALPRPYQALAVAALPCAG